MASDRRTTFARPDVAARSLEGAVDAARYVDPTTYEIAESFVDLRTRPAFDAARDTAALYGERAHVLDVQDGWAFAQLEHDGYVGYIPAVALRPVGAPATHRVAAIRTFLFERPDFKGPFRLPLSLGSRLTVLDRDGPYVRVEDGFVWAAHLAPVQEPAADFVTEAGKFLGLPYLWGGRSSLGLDCSGLVQLALGAAGVPFPRDSDMQARAGRPHATDEALSGLARGDLVFWKGHVGIMEDAQTLLHATAWTMTVIREPLRTARDRIRANGYGEILAVRRPV